MKDLFFTFSNTCALDLLEKGERYRARNYTHTHYFTHKHPLQSDGTHNRFSHQGLFREQNILCPEQQNFRMGHSCELQLLGLWMRLLKLWRKAARWMSSSWIFQRHLTGYATTSSPTNFATTEFKRSTSGDNTSCLTGDSQC